MIFGDKKLKAQAKRMRESIQDEMETWKRSIGTYASMVKRQTQDTQNVPRKHGGSSPSTRTNSGK